MTGHTALRRFVATGSVLVAATTAFGAGFLVSEARHATADYRLTGAGLDTGLSCDRLRDWYVDHGLDQVTAWGWQGSEYRGYAVPSAPAPGIAADSAGSPARAPLDTQTGSATGTNVQEAGVDEPDIAKTTGDLLVRISDGSLKTDDLGGSAPHRLGVAPLDRIADPQLLLSGDRAIVLGGEVEDPAASAPLFPPLPRTWVRTYDLSDPSKPTLVDSRLYDGSLVAARQVGTAVRLVLDTRLPLLDFVHPSSSVTEKQALEHNRQVVRDSTVADWLPDVATSGQSAPTALVDCSDVAVPEVFSGLGTLSVVGFHAADPASPDSIAVASSSATAYMSPTHLYVATSPWEQVWQHEAGGPIVMPMNAPAPTRIYGFDLSGIAARYVGMGSLGGTVTGSWSMDEHDGVLRVATTSPFGRSTSIVMLRPESGRLLDIGRLDGLGVGQQLKSVRWFDDLAVLVTFQQTDPFYVVDVADPTEPRVLGALHLPGWSSYLHPVGPHLVLGLGQNSSPEVMIEPPRPLPSMPRVPIPPAPTPYSSGDVSSASPEPVDPPLSPFPVMPMQRAKATLFDISDLAHPRDVDTVTYPAGSMPTAATDPHQVTWLPDRDTLLTVIRAGAGDSAEWTSRAWVSVLTIRGSALDDRLVPVPATYDVNDVRTVPLADGRVVLVAGDSVRFLAV